MESPRGGGRHAVEIADFWVAYAKCQALYELKQCNKPPDKPPVWCRVIEKVSGTPEQLETAGKVSTVIGVRIGVVIAPVVVGPRIAPIVRSLPIKAPNPGVLPRLAPAF